MEHKLVHTHTHTHTTWTLNRRQHLNVLDPHFRRRKIDTCCVARERERTGEIITATFECESFLGGELMDFT